MTTTLGANYAALLTAALAFVQENPSGPRLRSLDIRPFNSLIDEPVIQAQAGDFGLSDRVTVQRPA